MKLYCEIKDENFFKFLVCGVGFIGIELVGVMVDE